MGRMRFVFGRAGSGKTRYCLRCIARQLRRSPLKGPAQILLVPDQATYQMERALACSSGVRGYARGAVVSFKRLAQLVQSASTPPTRRSLWSTSRQLLMRQVIAQVGGRLRHWNRCRARELAGPILRLLDELSRAAVRTSDLRALVDSVGGSPSARPGFGDKLHDLVVLAEEFERAAPDDLDDAHERFDRYRERIGQIDWLAGASVYVDGFAGLTGRDYAVLAATARLAEMTTITLCLNADALAGPPEFAEWDPFATVRDTYDRLVKLADAHDIPVAAPIVLHDGDRRRYRASPLLSNLERHLATVSSGDSHRAAVAAQDVQGDVELICARTRRDEVELAAGKIIELVRDRGFRYREVSVVVRALVDYDTCIRSTFDELGIPYFLDARRPIGRSPVARLICGAVGAVVHNYDSASMLRYLKSSLAPIDADEAARLENYVLACGITGGAWLKPWKRKGELIGGDDENTERDVQDQLDELNRRRRELVKPLTTLAKNLGVGADGTGEIDIDVFLNALITLLKELRVAEQVEEWCDCGAGDDGAGQFHRQVWQSVRDLFVQLHRTLKRQTMRPAQFLQILEDSFSDMTVGVVPARLDQVLVGEIERTRHPQPIRAGLVLGFNEGLFPEPAREDAILTDDERRTLDVADLARPADVETHYAREQYYAYIALTRASEFLWVSYAERDRRGQRLYPSRYVERLESLTGRSVRKVASTQVLSSGPTDVPITLDRVCAVVVEAIDDGIGADEADFWLTLAGGLLTKPSCGGRLRNYIQAYSDRNEPALSRQLTRPVYDRRLSLSQIESFYRCPFQHFCRYGLKAEPRRRFRLEPVDLGLFRHRVMFELWQRVKTLKGPKHLADGTFADSLVDEAVNHCTRSMRDHVLFSSARNRYIFERTTDELKTAFAWQVHNLLMGDFRPAFLEHRFEHYLGRGHDAFVLVGRIDRIDLADAGGTVWPMVIDYKSRHTQFRFPEWFAGTDLQLPGYMLAVIDFAAAPIERSRSVAPGAAIFVPLTPKSAAPTDQTDIAGRFAASGLVSWDAIDLLIDRRDSRGREFSFQIGANNTPIRADSGSLLQADQFRAVLRHTERAIASAAEQIGDGHVAIEPFRRGRSAVCSYCDFRTVCRFDPFINHYRTASVENKLAVLKSIMNHDD